MCFAQGVVWTLILSGWRHWNRSAKFSGQTVGAKIRRWWWGVNNWKIPETKLKNTKLAKNVSEVSAAFLEVWHPWCKQAYAPPFCLLTALAVLQERVLERCTRLSVSCRCISWRSGSGLRNIIIDRFLCLTACSSFTSSAASLHLNHDSAPHRHLLHYCPWSAYLSWSPTPPPSACVPNPRHQKTHTPAWRRPQAHSDSRFHGPYTTTHISRALPTIYRPRVVMDNSSSSSAIMSDTPSSRSLAPPLKLRRSTSVGPR